MQTKKQVTALICIALIILGLSRWYRHPKLPVKEVALVSQFHKTIALTFDDGPYGMTTAQVLSILEAEQVPATFFLIGKNAEQHPDQVLRMIVDGDVIGNHSYSHSRDLPTEPVALLREDIAHDQKILLSISGLKPHLFRAPYGAVSDQMTREITQEGYVMVGWNVDPNDWNNNISSTTITTTILSKAKPNDILLFHDGHEIGTDYSRANTVAALPTIIDSLKKQGYTFVTVDKILRTHPYRSR